MALPRVVRATPLRKLSVGQGRFVVHFKIVDDSVADGGKFSVLAASEAIADDLFNGGDDVNATFEDVP